jgi:hypothetical protein
LTRRGRGGELPSPPQAWREAAAPSFGVLPFSDIGLQVHHGTAVVSDYDNLFNLWRVRDQVQSAREVWLYYPNVNRFYHRSIKEVLKYIPLNQVVHLVLTCNQHLTWFGAKAVVEELFPLEFELIGQTRDANGQWVLSYRRGKAVAAHNAERHTGWTFGLLTLGKKRDEVLKYIDSIERACPDSYEIVIVCPHELTWLGDRSNLRVIRFSEKDDLGWITRKKNLICEEATFSDILICHDRFTVAHDFFTAFERWGYSYGIAAPRVCFENGARALDWAIVSSENRVWSTGGLLDYRAYSRYAYVPGGATLVRKSFAQRYPWSETLFWNEHEDVELCRRAQRSGEIIYLADSTVITSNDRWLQENPEIPYDDQTEQVLGGPVGEQRVHFGQHCQCG